MSNYSAEIEVSRLANPITGTLIPPGDKSITHRALLFGALTRNGLSISNFSKCGDCLRTRECLQALGYALSISGGVISIGPRAGIEPRNLRIECGDSGTCAWLGGGCAAGDA